MIGAINDILRRIPVPVVWLAGALPFALLLWDTFTGGLGADPVQAIEHRLEFQAQGTWLPFAVLDPGTGSAVGMTNFMNADARNCRLEIGGTWYRRSVQRTALNTACKLILLRYAFETLGCIAVEFRTHFFNHQSRRAIERLGAKLDGVLRSHQRADKGILRDTCVYSIVQSEWPTVEAHLEYRLHRGRDD